MMVEIMKKWEEELNRVAWMLSSLKSSKYMHVEEDNSENILF